MSNEVYVLIFDKNYAMATYFTDKEKAKNALMEKKTKVFSYALITSEGEDYFTFSVAKDKGGTWRVITKDVGRINT